MTAHKPAQVLRHAAIVLAGTASLSLTVAAGAYIVNQMADTHQPGTTLSTPPTAAAKEMGTHTVPTLSEALRSGGNRDLPAAFIRTHAETRIATNSVVPNAAAPQSDSSTGTPSALCGKLRLGTTYVGARVAPVRSDTVAFTVDTNALSALTDFLPSEPLAQRLDVDSDPAASTQVRAELDTHGEVTMTFSDPALGEHAMRVNRYTAPAPNTPSPAQDATTLTDAATVSPENAATPQDSTTHPGLTTAPAIVDV
ncbi:hypothetical protein [Nocardia australiensis]|uniref:hypothetical protein n=1 Tax=Nocardia australiensis TaxID=2887191 RepID=UPI001D13A541|nr:hypothetical protein [Nocardia australiensis]